MDLKDVKPGLQIRTAFQLESTAGIHASERTLSLRKPDTDGVVQQFLPGHGGDIWLIAHEGDDYCAAYGFTEFEPK